MLRVLVTELTPPFAMRQIRHLWRRAHGLGTHTFEGCYPSLEATPCGPGRYDDDAIAITMVEAARRELDALRDSAGRSAPMIDDSGQLLLPLIASQFSGPLTVLDFGAGPARGLMNILRYGRRIDRRALRYVIVETEAVCRAFAKSGLSLEGLSVGEPGVETLRIEAVSRIPDELPAPLIVNAGSSIQYVSDHRAVLRRMAALAPQCVVISQTPMSDGPTYARVQLNIPHKRLAQWVFNRGEFIADM